MSLPFVLSEIVSHGLHVVFVVGVASFNVVARLCVVLGVYSAGHEIGYKNQNAGVFFGLVDSSNFGGCLHGVLGGCVAGAQYTAKGGAL